LDVQFHVVAAHYSVFGFDGFVSECLPEPETLKELY
jgi:hypothetical protein